ncbi:MAG TPA: PEP-CTERM sorting domain-containing protein [Pyrinomonadaceae bacterium]|nr:PEP-CTERM sorting domain-containing protein [Pyrinomonadaceae bacterium]
MSKILSAFCLLLVLVLTPSTTRADPIVVTDGFLSIMNLQGYTAFLAGDDFGFIAAGERGASAPQSCFPCPSGTVLGVGSFFQSSTLGFGSAALNGMVFPRVGFAGTFTFTGPAVTVPFTATDLILTSPFMFSGHLIACAPECFTSLHPLFTVDLVGSGMVTIDLRFNGFDREGRPLFSLREAKYEFEVPEPVSILLLGSGLAALGATLRRRRHSER